MSALSDPNPVIHRREDCRGCHSRTLDLIFRLEPTPIGDAFVLPERVGETQPTFPIDLFMCRDCGLAQLLDVIDPAILYGDYIYLTGSSVGLDEHFRSYADAVASVCQLQKGALVVDLGSNDGTLLKRFMAKGMKVLGVEPAVHIAEQATADGVPTVGEFFDPVVARRLVQDYGSAKVVTANNVFANIDDLDGWVAGIDEILAPDGVFVFESFYLADLVRNMVFDFIYHEHLTAFSVKPVKRLFELAGMELATIQRVPTKGGSLRYFIQRPGGPISPDGVVDELLAEEAAMSLYGGETFARFARKVDSLKAETRAFLESAKGAGKAIAGFGASITGTTLIYHFDIGDYLDYLVDDNPGKQGRFSPGLHLPVYPVSVLAEKKPDIVLILAWRFAEMFMRQQEQFRRDGGVFAIPVPEFKVVGPD